MLFSFFYGVFLRKNERLTIRLIDITSIDITKERMKKKQVALQQILI